MVMEKRVLVSFPSPCHRDHEACRIRNLYAAWLGHPTVRLAPFDLQEARVEKQYLSNLHRRADNIVSDG
ncbi:hypothetical protein ZHAS_00020509 [Anopheles sinensis]|uniref:Uncharacterized protein n=1 Tax=Anopheles sinensis TaxID=74873 RepID=A0A084WQ17_ANOSI|nr:hypothetical protein ZHAS_00020509 [Anopheles sinensis]